jgi:hypothetical protein
MASAGGFLGPAFIACTGLAILIASLGRFVGKLGNLDMSVLKYFQACSALECSSICIVDETHHSVENHHFITDLPSEASILHRKIYW